MYLAASFGKYAQSQLSFFCLLRHTCTLGGYIALNNDLPPPLCTQAWAPITINLWWYTM